MVNPNQFCFSGIDVTIMFEIENASQHQKKRKKHGYLLRKLVFPLVTIILRKLQLIENGTLTKQ